MSREPTFAQVRREAIRTSALLPAMLAVERMLERRTPPMSDAFVSTPVSADDPIALAVRDHLAADAPPRATSPVLPAVRKAARAYRSEFGWADGISEGSRRVERYVEGPSGQVFTVEG